MRALARHTWRRPQRRLLVRGRESRTYGATGPITFPNTPLNAQVRIALGADLSADPATWAWEEITDRVRLAPAIAITQWRRDESATTTPSSAQLTLDNEDGRFSRRNPAGPYYGLLSKNTPIWISVDPGDGMHSRFEGFVNAWPYRWDRSGTESVVPIECSGVLRRLSQGSRSMSAMRRSILATNPEGYWPLEDDDEAVFASSAVGGSNMTRTGTVDFAAFTDLKGASQTPDLSAGSLYGTVAGVSATAWHAEFAIKSGFMGPAIGRILTNTATHKYFRIFLPSAAGQSVRVFITLSDGTTTTALTGTAVAASWANTWHHIAITAEQSGGNIVCRLYHDGVLEASDTTAGTLTGAYQFWANHQTVAITSMSHIALGSGTTVSDAADGLDGFDGEQAHARIERLCDEEGILHYSVASESVAMGPQPVGTLLGCVREAEAADHGTLYERGWGLAYASRAERENQPAAFALDFDDRDVAVEPEPTDDDQRIRNVVTVSRPGGGEATYEQSDGPMGTGTDGPGFYDDSTSLNVETDADLLNQASYLVHLGTVDEDRWPRIDLDLRNSPDLIPAVTAMVPGTRNTASNPPDQLAPDVVDMIVEGYSERFDEFTWDVALNTTPASPHHVFQLAETAGDIDAFLGYLVPDSCVLAEDVAQLEVNIDVTSDPLWSTSADDWTPAAAIVINGEVMLVSSVSGGSNPQTLTVQRAYNGVLKEHTTGDAVEFLSPGVLGL